MKMQQKMSPRHIAYAIAALLILIIIGVFVYHRIQSAEELRFLADFDTGQTVDIDGKKVNYKVFNSENTGETIILMPGLSVQDMALSFRPLAERINARIVLINRPGYAFSEETGMEADVDYIIEYHRKVMESLNISGPVVLMPHSIAGQYAMYWAEKYPEQIDSIIGLDIGSPFLFKDETAPSAVAETVKYFGAKLGFGRIVMNRSDFAPLISNLGYYTDEEANALWYLSGTINPYSGFAKSETLLCSTNAQKIVAALSDNYAKKRKLFISADYTAEGFGDKARSVLMEAFHNDADAVEKHIAEHRRQQEKTLDSLKADENVKTIIVPGTHAIYLYPSDTLVNAINGFLNE